MKLRDALPEDNMQLLELDRRVSQGEWIELAFEKKNFFFKSSQFKKSRILVVEDNGKIIGTLSAGIKEVFLNNKKINVGSVFDLRLDPEYRKNTSREYYSGIKEMDRWLIENNAEFSCGYVRIDNERAMKAITKRGYAILKKIKFYSAAISRRMNVNEDYFYNEQEILEMINKKNRKKQLFFDRQETADLPLWKNAIGIRTENGYACCRIWDVAQEKEIIIYEMPWYLNLLGKTSYFTSRFLPLPYFPPKNHRIKYWLLMDLIYDGKDKKKLIRKLLKKVNNICLENKTRFLLIPSEEDHLLHSAMPYIFKPAFDFYYIYKTFGPMKLNPNLSLDLDPRDF
ncbi:MAG: GNAT family N-acetyltransferase [bacterium]|nr:GNAT family N-acetyltransferase [bacterium]